MSDAFKALKNSTSAAALNGLPSENRTPGRSLIVQLVKSAFGVNDSAR